MPGWTSPSIKEEDKRNLIYLRPKSTLKINLFVEVTFSISRVAAYEEFHGTGKRFKMMSNEVSFTLDYTPKFIKQPIVWEKKASPLSNVRHRQLPREKRGIFRVNETKLIIIFNILKIVEDDNNAEDDH